MKIGPLSVSLILIFATQAVDTANILVLNTVISHSHTIFTDALTEALAAAGHKLVVLSVEDQKHGNPNITTFHLEGGFDTAHMTVTLEDLSKVAPTDSFMDNTHCILNWNFETGRRLLFSGGNKRFYQQYKNRTFDLILADTSGPECFLKYTHVFGNPPIVGYTSFFAIHGDNLGDFDHPAYVPHFTSTLTDRMNFFERLVNYFNYKYYALVRRYWLFPRLDKLSEEFFGFHLPTIQELEDRIALFLSDEHFSVSYPKPRVPASIPVAGLHIKPPKPLPQDIEKFVSEAKHGVIYFSLGSSFLSRRMTDERKRMFLEAFAQLPQRVLWKYEDDTLTHVPNNVMTRSWFSQMDILAHNNTKLFITHNGYLSTQEAIYCGVPMLGIPLVLDQFKNNVKIVKRGIGLRLDLNQIESSHQIQDKIRTIINDSSFKQNVQRESVLFRDRPMHPLETAIYWIEYVLRHNGASHLRVASLDLYWFQYYLLDIYFFIAVTLFIVYYTFMKLIDLNCRRAMKQKEL